MTLERKSVSDRRRLALSVGAASLRVAMPQALGFAIGVASLHCIYILQINITLIQKGSNAILWDDSKLGAIANLHTETKSHLNNF